MARERTLKVTILGDASDLEKRLDKLGDSVAETSKEIEDLGKSSTKSSKELSRGFDGVRDSADDSERRITGFRDSLTGTQDVMKGLKEGDMVALSTGFADLASSVANLGADMLEWGKKAYEGAKNVVAAHGASVVAKGKDIAATVAHKVASVASTVATTAQTAAQWALNAAMSANPIMLVVIGIGLLVAAFIVAWKHSETFREIVTGAFNAVVDAAMWAFNWVKNNWPLLLAILTGPIGLAVLAITKNWDEIKAVVSGVKDWISEKAVGMWDGIKDAFKGVINFIIGAWNKLQFKLPSFAGMKVAGQTVIPGWEGPTLGVPQIAPVKHSGGVFRSPNGPGTSGMALLQDGERVTRSAHGGGDGLTIIVQGSMLSTERELVSILKRAQRDGVVV